MKQRKEIEVEEEKRNRSQRKKRRKSLNLNCAGIERHIPSKLVQEQNTFHQITSKKSKNHSHDMLCIWFLQYYCIFH